MEALTKALLEFYNYLLKERECHLYGTDNKIKD